MARFNSYQWNTQDGICRKHMLPSVPCPACLANAKDNPDLYLELEGIERSGWITFDEMTIPEGFNPEIHEIHYLSIDPQLQQEVRNTMNITIRDFRVILFAVDDQTMTVGELRRLLFNSNDQYTSYSETHELAQRINELDHASQTKDRKESQDV